MTKLTILALHLGYGGVESAITSLANSMCRDYDREIVSVYKLYDEPAYKLDDRIKVTYLMDTDIALRVDKYKKLIHSHKYGKLVKQLHSDYKLNIFKLTKDTIDSYKTVKKKESLLIDYIKNMDTDIVLSTRMEHNILVSKYASNCYKVAWEHNHGDAKYIKDVVDSCYNIDTLVVVSKELYKLYTNEVSKTKIAYVPNVINTPCDKKSKLDNNKLISVGRLVTVKGFDDMIDVMKCINDKNKDVTLEIIGDGDLYSELQDKVNSYKLNEVVKLSGFKDREYINNALETSSLFLLTSHSESFGLVVVEAMSAGVPTIALSSAEGVTELIDGENGILIDNRDINKMADKVLELLNDRKTLKEMGKKAYKTSLNYTDDRVYNKWLDIFENNFEK